MRSQALLRLPPAARGCPLTGLDEPREQVAPHRNFAAKSTRRQGGAADRARVICAAAPEESPQPVWRIVSTIVGPNASGWSHAFVMGLVRGRRLLIAEQARFCTLSALQGDRRTSAQARLSRPSPLPPPPLSRVQLVALSIQIRSLSSQVALRFARSNHQRDRSARRGGNHPHSALWRRHWRLAASSQGRSTAPPIERVASAHPSRE